MVRNNKAIIIGGGLLGVATFYELVSRDVETVLVDKETDVARGTSYANGGVLHPSLPDPWNSPGIGRHLMASLFDPNAPMKLHFSQAPYLIQWGLSFLRNSVPSRHVAITKANFELAHYSTRQTDALQQFLGLSFEHATPGSLKIFRNENEKRSAIELAELLAQKGLKYQVLNRDALLALEPALAHATDEISGALIFPDDLIGNARLFCERLAEEAVARGGIMRLGEAVDTLIMENGRVMGIRIGEEALYGDVILCAGVASSALASPVGVKLPIRPAKGYSITLDASALKGEGPRHPIIDAALHIAVTPLGEKLRVLGMAEFMGDNLFLDPKRLAMLRGFFERLLPEIGHELDWDSAENWTGLRPMSSDGRPFIGASGVDGLWLNCGHGHLGWTKAVGSARVISDIIMGKVPEIDAAPFSIDTARRHSLF